jgi:CheY-like chemotaxis protein
MLRHPLLLLIPWFETICLSLFRRVTSIAQSVTTDEGPQLLGESVMYRIAIVDDNETWCFVLALRLQQQGYAVSTFTDTQTFLRKADQFDLVLVDYLIPTPLYQRGMDGPEVICKVKHQLKKPPKLVLISSFFANDWVKDAMAICPEADAVLSKQIGMPELFAKIQQLLESRPPMRQMQGSSAQSRYR